MNRRIVKYNPAFLSGEELVENFVVRKAELDLVIQALTDNTGDSNQHVLIIGPRGIGKTMLVLRAVEEARNREDLAKRWYPLVFSEESYQVTSPGEFWLEAVFHLAKETDCARWKTAYEELKGERDEDRLRERALAQLMDFADSENRRLLLVVENLNMLLGEQMNDDQGWTLRHTLLHEPRVMLLATATNRFEQIDNSGKPMFELFKPIELEALNEDDCRRMWTSISGAEPSDRRIRPIQILTGGNPRLLSIISSFGARLSFKELMDDLMQLVDDHTEYFKSHLDNLAPIERKVYLALVELWDPATAREVAENARLDVNKTSSLLKRLKNRGAVVEANGQGPRRKLYQVAERLYNIYYLMRRHGAPSQRVRAVVNFMVAFYGETELVKTICRIAQEACGLEPGARLDHYTVYEQVLRCRPDSSLHVQIIQGTPTEFLYAPDTPASLKDLLAIPCAKENGKQNTPSAQLALKLTELKTLFDKGVALHRQRKYAQAIATYDELIRRSDQTKVNELRTCVASALLAKAIALYEQKGIAQAIAIYDDLVVRYGQDRNVEVEDCVAMALINKGIALHRQRQHAQAIATYEEIIQRFGETTESELRLRVAMALFNKGVALASEKRYAQAVATYDEFVAKFGAVEEPEVRLHVAMALLNKGVALHNEGKYASATESYDEVVRRFGEATETEFRVRVATALLNRGLVMQIQKQYAKAVRTYTQLIERFAGTEETELRVRVAYALLNTGLALSRQKKHAQAVKACDAVIEQFGEAEDPALQGSVAHARARKSDALFSLKKRTQAIASWTAAEQIVEDHPRNAELRNSLAWSTYEHRVWGMLEKGEKYARRAVELEPTNAFWRHTLASILYLSGKGAEALPEAGSYVTNKDAIEEGIDDAVDLFVGLAACGQAKEAIRLLEDSPSADLLEPLIVGLRLYAGEDVKRAAEIIEVAKDVVKRIEERRKELESRPRA